MIPPSCRGRYVRSYEDYESPPAVPPFEIQHSSDHPPPLLIDYGDPQAYLGAPSWSAPLLATLEESDNSPFVGDRLLIESTPHGRPRAPNLFLRQSGWQDTMTLRPKARW